MLNTEPYADSALAPRKDLPRLSASAIRNWMLVGLAFSVIFDADARQPILFWLGMVLGFGVVMLIALVPCRWMPVPLFIVLLNAPDLTQSSEDIKESGVIVSATPWQFHLGPLSPALWIAGLLVLACLRLHPAWHRRDFPLLVHLAIVVPVMSLIHGYATQSPSEFITDAKLVINFGLGLVFFTQYYTLFPRKLLSCCQLFLAIAAGRYALDAFYLFAGIYKTVISGFNRVSIDSAKGVLIVFIILFIAWLVIRRGRKIALILLPAAFYLLLAYQTRWLVLTLVMGVILVVLSVGGRVLVRSVCTVAVLWFVAMPLLATLRPHVLEVIGMRFSSFGLLLDQFDFKGADSTRFASVVNSVSLLHERGALLTGLGYGSWYSDDVYPFSYLTDGDFDLDSLASRRFYRVHDFGFHLLFKIGLIGVVLYLGAFAWPLFALWRDRARIARDRDRLGMMVFLVLIGIAPTFISSLFWSAKGLLLSGAYLATIWAWKKELMAGFGDCKALRMDVGRLSGQSDAARNDDLNVASGDLASAHSGSRATGFAHD